MTASGTVERTGPQARALTLAETAWIAALPCALLTLAALLLLGPPLGHAFLGPGAESFWRMADARPEPVEHARYLVALAGTALLAGAVAAASRRPPRLRPALARGLTLASQLALAAFVVVCFAAQNDVVLSADSHDWEHTKYFTVATLLAAGALALALFAALRSRRARELFARCTRETRVVAATCLLAAAALAAAWLLTVINLDSSVGNTNPAVSQHLLWSMDEAFAILDGRTPLVNFHSQYGQLVPYAAALAMGAFGATIGVYTIAMASLSGLALLAVYATLRRVARSSLTALLLFAPFVATSFFMKLGPLADRYTPLSLFSLWPVRYGGAYLLAWLAARHIDGAAPRRRWPLLLVAGLVALNNPEFGLPALGATVVALACAAPPRSRRALARLIGTALAGLAGAAVLVSALTLARAGALPRPALLFEFSRLYGVGGWGMLRMATIGLHLALFATFVATLALAVVRAARGERDALLTGMLAWSGAFGLTAGSYFVGRSHPEVLIDLFSPWALSLALLLVALTREGALRSRRRAIVPALLVLFGCGLAICSLPQTPAPWQQVARLRHRTPQPVFEQREATRLVARTAHRGRRVAILLPLGHRVAYSLDLVDVAPYSSIESMPTRQQLRALLRQVRGEGIRTLYVSQRFTFPEELALLRRAGWTARAQEGDAIELAEGARPGWARPAGPSAAGRAERGRPGRARPAGPSAAGGAERGAPSDLPGSHCRSFDIALRRLRVARATLHA